MVLASTKSTTTLLGIHRQRTKAYHPAAKGIVERFHKQLKTALKCSNHPHLWTNAVPLVLLGIRTASKDDLKCSSAEMVYGTTLRLPGELFVCKHSDTTTDPLSYVDTPKSLNSLTNSIPFVHKELSKCTHVFVQNDSRKPPLQPTYDGPFQVISRGPRYVVIMRKNTRTDTTSIDRLKPAHIELSTSLSPDTSPSQLVHTPTLSSPTPSCTTTHTRLGRQVQFLDRLSHTITWT